MNFFVKPGEQSEACFSAASASKSLSQTNGLPPPVVILAAGDYPTHPVPLGVLQRAATVVCLDSAADAYQQHTGRLPHYAVGDADSIAPTTRQRLGEHYIYDAEQDTNDLCKAVRFLLRNNVRQATILGATGRREDHTLGNIFHLPELARQLSLTMLTNYGAFYPCHGYSEHRVAVGTQVSVFNINATELHSIGLRWPIKPFNALWQGTLNEATASQITIEANGDYLLFFSY